MEPTSLLRKNNKIRTHCAGPLNAKLIFFAGFKGLRSQAGEEIPAREIRRSIDERNGDRWTHF
jgi:hypothetical protein